MWINSLAALLAAFAPYVWPALVFFIVLYFRKAIRNRLATVTETGLEKQSVEVGRCES